jgi:hypothetical protein
MAPKRRTYLSQIMGYNSEKRKIRKSNEMMVKNQKSIAITGMHSKGACKPA